MENLVKKIDNIHTVLAKFDDIVDVQAREIVSSHISYSPNEIKEHIESLQDKERELKIGIIGRVKAGKSSLINALLFDGRDVLPKAATPMTAALTTIGTSENFYAEVDFFNSKDIADLADKKSRYDLELKEEAARVLSEEEERRSRKTRPGVPAKPVDLDKIQTKAKRVLDARSPDLKSASDLYGRIQRSSINPEALDRESRIDASSEAELKDKLYEYVGAEGKFMPFTRSVHIGMPLDTLHDLRVIDTPGLNDAVASREQRTYEMLKECNVVFIVSPAGQFLNAQDLELADRLSKREGIQEIYVVASQVDLQLHGDEKEKHHAVLPDVIKSLERILIQQTTDTLSRHENQVLKELSSKANKLFISSGICQSILTNGSNLDENAQHALSLLRRNYPDYFANETDKENYLKELANRDSILESISQVRKQKDSILEKQVHDFIDVQTKSADEVIDNLVTYLEKLSNQISSADLSEATKRAEAIEQVRTAGAFTANDLYKDSFDELKENLNVALKAHLKSFRSETKGDIDSSEGSYSESYQVKKDGLLSGAARFFGMGGYEERSRDITTVQASTVRIALEDLREFIISGLIEITEIYLRKWRKTLTSDMINALRNKIGDENVDADKLSSVCRTAVNSLASFPEPDIGDLPAELSKSGKLTGTAAERFSEEANDYLFSLNREATDYTKHIKSTVEALGDYDIGESLFDGLRNELEKTKEMVKNKKITLDKLKMLSQHLEGAR